MVKIVYSFLLSSVPMISEHTDEICVQRISYEEREREELGRTWTVTGFVSFYVVAVKCASVGSREKRSE
jgi:hypothetical protein